MYETQVVQPLLQVNESVQRSMRPDATDQSAVALFTRKLMCVNRPNVALVPPESSLAELMGAEFMALG